MNECGKAMNGAGGQAGGRTGGRAWRQGPKGAQNRIPMVMQNSQLAANHKKLLYVDLVRLA